MKLRNFSVLVLTFAANLSSLAMAQELASSIVDSPRVTVHANLTDNVIDPKLVTIHSPVNVIVNFAQNSVRVNIGPQCPRGAKCIVGGYSFIAGIKNISKDSCGVETIVASKDLRTVDGELLEIEVTDNSRSICERVYPFMTEVKLETAFFSRKVGGEVKTSSLLRGIAPLAPLKTH